MSNSLFNKLESMTKELIDKIREVSRSQKDTWQQIPFLALQADGRSGYSDQYARAYTQGYWAVRATVRNGSYAVYVDLETGELVNAFNSRKVAEDEDVLLIASSLNQIDVASLIKELRKQVKQPTSPSYNVQEQEKWRQEILKEYNLKPREYRRKVSLQEVFEGNVIAGLVD